MERGQEYCYVVSGPNPIDRPRAGISAKGGGGYGGTSLRHTIGFLLGSYEVYLDTNVRS